MTIKRKRYNSYLKQIRYDVNIRSACSSLFDIINYFDESNILNPDFEYICNALGFVSPRSLLNFIFSYFKK